uniref:3'-5' exonuclease domain-containing protein n=1 Tax=Thelazia callipaeda TaxID=103827 RepID=A0A0N5CKT0_THECL
MDVPPVVRLPSSSRRVSEFTNLAIVRDIIEEAYHVKVDKQGQVYPSKKKLGYELFLKRFEPHKLVAGFLTVVKAFPIIAAECSKYNSWWTPKFYHLVFLIADAFMSLLASEYVTTKIKNKNYNQNPTCNIQITISDKQWFEVFKTLLPLNFNFDSNFWSLADYVLNLTKCPESVARIIIEAARNGEASFTALDYCIRNKILSRYIYDPTVLYKAALLGPLRASSVESFAARRTEEFRQRCREFLIRLEHMTYSVKGWERAVVSYLGSLKQCDVNGRVVSYNYASFRDSVTVMMHELRRMPPADDRINVKWAHYLIKKCAAKYYCEKTWKFENLHEVLWTILAQRPCLRKFVVHALNNDFKDPLAAEMWRTYRISPECRTHMPSNITEERLDPRTPNPPYLSIPPTLQPIEFVRHPSHLNRVSNFLEEYANDNFPPIGIDAEWSSYVSYSKATILQLAIPCYVFIIDIDGIKPWILSEFFTKLFVEWKLLKIGYRFDEDLFQLQSAVQNCSALYHPQNLICIGKLVKFLMRESAKRPEVNLDGVFYPEKAQAIKEYPGQASKIGPRDETIGLGHGKSTNRPSNGGSRVGLSHGGSTSGPGNGGSIMGLGHGGPTNGLNCDGSKFNFGGSFKKVNQMKIFFLDNSEEHLDRKIRFLKFVVELFCFSPILNRFDKKCYKVPENPLLRDIRGLSALCERVLGKPLDKSEQCSVWDRRPLRDLQLRYAALDAYCMLMLYDKCIDWASRLNLNLDEIRLKQEISTARPLPLFCDRF